MDKGTIRDIVKKLLLKLFKWEIKNNLPVDLLNVVREAAKPILGSTNITNKENRLEAQRKIRVIIKNQFGELKDKQINKAIEAIFKEVEK